MLYFVWFDDSPKKLASDKLQEALAAYRARYNAAPSLVLVSPADQLELPDIAVRSERTVQPNSFWLGFEETPDPSTV